MTPGLPKYRNGGLILDPGILEAINPSFQTRRLEVGDPAVVEWRALTVAATDGMVF